MSLLVAEVAIVVAAAAQAENHCEVGVPSWLYSAAQVSAAQVDYLLDLLLAAGLACCLSLVVCNQHLQD
jgi:hypothetical protein